MGWLRGGIVPDDGSLVAENRAFGRFWAADVVERLADGLGRVALPWLILALTGSPFSLGVAFALRSAPDVVVAPAVGAAIDRLPRKPLLSVARASTGVVLAVLGWAAIAGNPGPSALYAGMLALSVLGNLAHNTRQTMVGDLVAEDRLDAANAWLFGTGAALSVGFVLGGGALTALVGPATTLALAGAVHVLAGLAALAVPVPSRSGAGGSTGGIGSIRPLAAVRASVRTLREGLAAIRAAPRVLDVLLLGVAFNVLVVPYGSVLLPTAGRDAFGSAAAFTAMLVAWRAGSVAGNGLVARVGRSREAKMAGGIAVVGAGALAAGLAGLGAVAADLPPVAGVAAVSLPLFVVGLGNPLFNAPGSSVLQSAVDEDRRGTVIALQNSLLQASFPVPLLAAGYLLAALSPFSLLAASGVGGLLLSAVAALRFGLLRTGGSSSGEDAGTGRRE